MYHWQLSGLLLPPRQEWHFRRGPEKFLYRLQPRSGHALLSQEGVALRLKPVPSLKLDHYRDVFEI